MAESLPGSASRFRQDGQTDCFTREERRTGWQIEPVMHESEAFDKSRADEETASAENVNRVQDDGETGDEEVSPERHDPDRHGALKTIA